MCIVNTLFTSIVYSDWTWPFPPKLHLLPRNWPLLKDAIQWPGRSIRLLVISAASTYCPVTAIYISTKVGKLWACFMSAIFMEIWKRLSDRQTNWHPLTIYVHYNMALMALLSNISYIFLQSLDFFSILYLNEFMC